MSNLPRIGRIAGLAGLVLFNITAGGEDTLARWEALFGPADISRVSGNGALTAGVNSYGRVTSCRWPSPGYYDQLAYRTISRSLPELGVPPWHGLQWAVRLGNAVYWLRGGDERDPTQAYADEGSTVIETRCCLRPGIYAVQSLFVHAQKDLLVAHVAVSGAAERPRIYWFENLTPCTRLIPELPLGDWAFDALNDFAVFANSEQHILYHFRPEAPGSADWERARALADRIAPANEWQVFGDGVWIGCATAEPWLGFQCATDESPQAAYGQIASGTLEGRKCAVGACHSAIELALTHPQSAWEATVFLGFGRNREEVDTLITYARERDYAGLREETEAYWTKWLAKQGLPAGAPLGAVRRRAALTLAQAMDRNSGAVVRAPITQPPLAVDCPGPGAWITLALDLLGDHERAERHLRFYLEALRGESRRGLPRGSLAAAYYANRREAAPHPVLDVEAVAWMLSSVWRHSRFLDHGSGLTYLASVWKPVSDAADFLAGWADSGGGPPLPSFDASALRDRQSSAQLLHTFMGLAAAMNIAAALGESSNESWNTRRRELEEQIRAHFAHDPKPLPLELTTPYWLKEVVPENREVNWDIWDATVEISGEPRPMRDVPFPTTAILAETASPDSFPDAFRAALQLIAAAESIYSGE